MMKHMNWHQLFAKEVLAATNNLHDMYSAQASCLDKYALGCPLKEDFIVAGDVFIINLSLSAFDSLMQYPSKITGIYKILVLEQYLAPQFMICSKLI